MMSLLTESWAGDELQVALECRDFLGELLPTKMSLTGQLQRVTHGRHTVVVGPSAAEP